MRRRIAAISIISVLVVLLAAPAAFAAQARISQPSDTVRERTDLRVEITRDSRAEPVDGAQLRLRRGGETLGDWVTLACKDSCGNRAIEQIWGPADDRRFDPATGEPFVSNGPLANGDYQFEVRIERGRFLEPVQSSRDVRLAVPPSAPTEVAAERDGREVRITWKKAPEPDVTGYRVERRSDDGWKEVSTTSEATYVDEPGPGTHAYRVIARRDDGRGGTLETASSEREVEVPEPEGGDEDDGNGNGNGNGGSGNGDGDNDDGGGNGGDGDGGDTSPDSVDEETSNGSSGSSDTRERRSSTRAPSLGSESRGIPNVFGREPQTADPDAYAEELDYGSAQNGQDADDDVVLSTGRDGAFGRMLDGERVATPIAVGLVLTATGLHLWRWLRVPAL